MNNKSSKIVSWLITALILISLILGTWGWHDYFFRLNLERDFWNSLFYGIQLFTMNSSFPDIHVPLALNIARFSAPASLAGAIIQGFLILTQNNFKYFRIKFFLRSHVIVCGYNRYSKAIVNDLISQGLSIVIIDDDINAYSNIEFGSRNVILIDESASILRVLQKAGLRHATLVLLLDDDVTNLKILSCLKELKVKERVILHLSDRKTYSLYKEISNSSGLNNLHVISDQNIVAARMADQYSPDQFISVLHPGGQPANILFVGDNPFILDLVRETAIMYHFANLSKARFIFSVPDERLFQHQLRSELPYLDKVVDFEIMDYGQLWKFDSPICIKNVSVCFISMLDITHSLGIARRMRQLFFPVNYSLEIPKIVLAEPMGDDTTPLTSELLDKLKALKVDNCGGITRFNAQAVINDEEVYDIIAKFINNSFTLREDKDYVDADTMWQQLSDMEKDWNRWPARHFHIKLRVCGAKIVSKSDSGELFDVKKISNDTLDLLARMEKRRWNAEKWLTGFVPGEYQEDKELEKFLKREIKYHPTLKPWDEISEAEQLKDYYGFNDIDKILDRAGMKIVHI